MLSAPGARAPTIVVNRLPPKLFRRPESNRPLRLLLACAAALAAAPSHSALPSDLAQVFREDKIPSSAVAVLVQRIGEKQPVLAHQAAKPMNPASTMKLVTTFAALELLGADYRWKTEAYADGPVVGGVLEGNLVLKGYGDPKITIEQFESLVAALRATGLATVDGDLVLDRAYFAPPARRPGAFDAEPLKPYNVGPDALLVNFNSVRFVFTPSAEGDAVALRTEPPLANVVFSGALKLAPGECGDWRAEVKASIASRGDRAQARFSGRYPAACGERDWYVALLDHRHYAEAMFEHYWKEAGGSFAGGLRDGKAPAGVKPLATLQSMPLYDAIRDINKLSNNVMAQQLFLTLATSTYPPPATAPRAATAVRRWLARRGLRFPELILENGSGLSRRERISAQSMAALLLAADASAVRADYESSLAVAATDGTVRKRFVDDDVADRALLKTGTLEGVRALAGYVLGHGGRRYVVVCFVNHRNAARAQRALDLLVEKVYAGDFDGVRR